jgi:polysaccharide biosynthesis protein PslG
MVRDRGRRGVLMKRAASGFGMLLLTAVVGGTGCVGHEAPAGKGVLDAVTIAVSSPDDLSGDCYDLDASPLLFASSRSGNGDIFVMRDGLSPVNITDNSAGDWDPEWSPACGGGRGECRIVFTSHRSGDSEIWTMDPCGRNLRNVSQHAAWDYWPSWSPDGRQVVFISERDGDPELFTQPADGGAAVQLTFNDEGDRLPSWSPDGSQIAFSAVRQGIEEIHLITVDGGHERAITRWPIKGTSPAWSPDGSRIAFVGWDESNLPGIYVYDLVEKTSRRLWQGQDWVGSLSWAGCGGADVLLFSAWLGGDHDLYALSLEKLQAMRLTDSSAWDDFPSLLASCSLESSLGTPPAEPRTEAPEMEKNGVAEVQRGANIADLGNAYLLQDMGFSWAKGYVNWETVEPEPGVFNWADPDNTVHAFASRGRRILLRIHGTPAWARPADTFLTYPPDDVSDFEDFVRRLAARYRGRIDAYEIWNEPNLNYEWGYLSPDAEKYTALLQAAYRAIKAEDPSALVVSGGLATTGDGSDTAVGDLVFLQGMYDAGAKGAFDALGSHPYAFGNPPDYVDPWGLSLSRVDEQRQVMLANDDADTPVWITELGWVLNSSWALGEHETIGVTEIEQAAYLARSFEKSAADWPYVQTIFIFNLDFASVPWYTASEPMRWYAIVNPDRTPRPAYIMLSAR